MPYVIARKGKPTMHQAGEREWVCQGLGQVGTGSSQRGAYTKWKNLVALAELPSDEADKLLRMRSRHMPFGAIPIGVMKN